jgi:hypothetical protein
MKWGSERQSEPFVISVRAPSPVRKSLKPQASSDSHAAPKPSFDKGSPPACTDEECKHRASARATLDQRTRPARRVGTPSILAERSRREPREDVNATGRGGVVRLIAYREAATNDRLEIKAPRYRSGHPHADVSRRYAASKDPIETYLERDRPGSGRLRGHDGNQQERERRSRRAVHLLCSHSDSVQERWRTGERVPCLARRWIGHAAQPLRGIEIDDQCSRSRPQVE